MKTSNAPCSSLDSGVIMRSRVMQLHYGVFSSNHFTERILELLNLIDFSDSEVTYDVDVTLFHNPLILKMFQI